MERYVFKPETLNGTKKRILLRIDMNGAEEGGYKAWRNAQELRKYAKLAEGGCSVVLLSHCGRKGKVDFKENMEFMVQLLKASGAPDIKYVDSLMGEAVVRDTQAPGIYLLKNVRASTLEKEGGRNGLCEFLANHFDVYVNNAPAVSHRNHTSVMMPLHMEGHLGNIFMEEVQRLEALRNSPEKILVWGGNKMDKSKYVGKLLGSGWKVLLGGIPAVQFKDAKAGITNEMTGLLMEHKNKIIGPVDYIERDGKIVDVGPKTVKLYSKILDESGGIFSGPLGIYEEGHVRSSLEMMKRCTAILGGHSGNIAHQNGLDGVITSGGAALAYLMSGTLPGIEAVVQSRESLVIV
ncbi:MAG: phosphoglycerate kinase [Candidatus Altiarchaeota archaeon]|nr:phosphoglycerate kinase [Candidatus Altiarchaeota archaeon]